MCTFTAKACVRPASFTALVQRTVGWLLFLASSIQRGDRAPVLLQRRLHKAFRGECDAECDDQLQHIITVHIRSRYADREVDNATIALAVASDETMQLMPAEHRPAAWFHYAIGNLFMDYVKARGPMNLWWVLIIWSVCQKFVDVHKALPKAICAVACIRRVHHTLALIRIACLALVPCHTLPKSTMSTACKLPCLGQFAMGRLFHVRDMLVADQAQCASIGNGVLKSCHELRLVTAHAQKNNCCRV